MDEDALNNNYISSEEVTPETIKEASKPARVNVMKNGPIVVEGNFEVTNSDGTTLKTMLMTSFCRCGGSKSMPYCDGTHRKIGFIDNM
jgi:membrane-associated HD superfamily phosphohydrolase